MKIILNLIFCLFIFGCTNNNNETFHSDSKIEDFDPNIGVVEDIDQEAQENLEDVVKSDPQVFSSLDPGQWQKMRWVSKVLLLLRGGNGLNSDDDIQYFINTSREKIVDELLEKDGFFETLIMFNFYYMGKNISDVYTTVLNEKQFSSQVRSNDPAFNAAVEFLKGGDYFDFFKANHKLPIFDSSEPYFTDEKGETHVGEPAFVLLEEAIEKEADDHLLFLSGQTDPVNMEEYCGKYQLFSPGLQNLGLTISFNTLVKPKSAVYIGCNFADPKKPFSIPSKDELIDRWENYKIVAKRVIDYAIKRRGVKVGTDLSKIDFIEIGDLVPGEKNNFFRGLSFDLQNSSTNFNRKRAAYILDRFLCDDLLPLDVELPEEHQGGVHGSEPSCYACHYRLDPMAGFFKDYGIQFNFYGGAQKILFDDLAEMDKVTYDESWLNPPNSPRKWNIGVIRSEKDETKNYYGESMDDLFRILSKMPEVKKCMTRRVFEFANGKNQNVDQGYIAQLTDEFTKMAKQSSSVGIKYLFKQVALSDTFQVLDPVTKECYDFPKGHNPQGAPPCQVNFILENKCSKCHFPFGGEGGLDLTTWTKLEGDRYGFDHIENGKQLSLDESFKRIAEALTSPDPKKRMPYKQHMDPTDRESLYLWVNEQMSGGQ